MWWKMDSNFLREIGEIAKGAKKSKFDPASPTRVLFAIQLISESLDYPVRRPGRHGKLFDSLVERGIMRAESGGYSAYEWLKENGRIGDVRARKPVRENSPSEMAEKTPKSAVSGFPRVFLSQGEIDSLNASYGQEKATAFYRKLNEYKERTGKQYASDYRAILSWVVDAVEKDAKKREDPAPSCYPTAEETQAIIEGGRTPEEIEEVRKFKNSPDFARYMERLNKLITRS